MNHLTKSLCPCALPTKNINPSVISTVSRPLRLWVRIPPGAWIFVCCECCVLSGRGLCDGFVTRPEESYRLWRVVVCDLETSKIRRLKPATGLWKIQPQWVVTPRNQTTTPSVISTASRPLRLWVRIPPGAWIFVCCDCCVLSGRGLCDGLVTRPEESYRLWRVVVCDLETSKIRRLKPATGL